MAMPMHSSSKDKLKSNRPLANFPPTLWGSSLTSLQSSHPDFESLTKDVAALKEIVKDMLILSTKNVIDNLELIDLLCRLGVSYHLEFEIDDILNRVFIQLPTLFSQNDFDLHSLALMFRTLRQHGFKMSSDVFNKLKNKEGGFMESLHNDGKGLLSLYEASFLGVKGEHILDEARSFTRDRLVKLAESSHPVLQKHIKKALFLPFHFYENRLQARQYISLYEEDESRNETLLKFAKLDYNRLQSLYQQELALLSKWWKDLNLGEHYTFARDRLVESYYWAVGMQFQPEFGLSRIFIAKYTSVLTVLDDIYDSYATLDELQLLTSAIQRGNTDAISQLPNYFKVIYKALMDLHDESEINGRNSFVKQAVKKLVENELVEKQWNVDGYFPKLDEYLQLKSITITNHVYLPASFVGMENMVDCHEYKWLQTNSKIEENACLILRFEDDILDDIDEDVSSIKCYMKDYGVSRDKAIEEIYKMIDEKWKEINEEYIKYCRVSRILLNFFLNNVRIIWLYYNLGDSFTNPEHMKHYIKPLFLDKFPM